MRRWFFAPGSWLTRAGMWFLGPLRFTGVEHVPRDGAFILVANHISLFDPLIVGSTAGQLAGRLVHFMAKQEVRRWPVIGWLATQAGVYFVRRGEGDRAAQRLSLELLASGEAIAVFPEGTRSRDGVLGEPRNGAALLAMRSACLDRRQQPDPSAGSAASQAVAGDRARRRALPADPAGVGPHRPPGAGGGHRAHHARHCGPVASCPARPLRIDRWAPGVPAAILTAPAAADRMASG